MGRHGAVFLQLPYPLFQVGHLLACGDLHPAAKLFDFGVDRFFKGIARFFGFFTRLFDDFAALLLGSLRFLTYFLSELFDFSLRQCRKADCSIQAFFKVPGIGEPLSFIM